MRSRTVGARRGLRGYRGATGAFVIRMAWSEFCSCFAVPFGSRCDEFASAVAWWPFLVSCLLSTMAVASRRTELVIVV